MKTCVCNVSDLAGPTSSITIAGEEQAVLKSVKISLERRARVVVKIMTFFFSRFQRKNERTVGLWGGDEGCSMELKSVSEEISKAAKSWDLSGKQMGMCFLVNADEHGQRCPLFVMLYNNSVLCWWFHTLATVFFVGDSILVCRCSPPLCFLSMKKFLHIGVRYIQSTFLLQSND